MEQTYEKPTITTLDNDDESIGEAVPMGNWVWTETVALGYAYAIAVVFITQIDVTP